MSLLVNENSSGLFVLE